jgi:regulator of protease activity HflC (stomatin/prohibitin superfamily)
MMRSRRFRPQFEPWLAPAGDVQPAGRRSVTGGLFRRITIMEYERGLKYARGRFERILEPGRHRLPAPSSKVVVIDVRPRFVTIPGQEVLTSDGVTLRLSLAAQYEIADPNLAINSVHSYEEALYLELQLALREIVGSSAIDPLLEERSAIGGRILEAAGAKAEAIGLHVHTVDLKDIMFPGDLKRMFAQVVQARKEGQAALERARGETAALRNLANAARMVEESPALIQLRLLQQVADSSGNTFVIGIPASTTPLPIRPGTTATPKPIEPGGPEDRPET